jgi:hypothetical protein
MPVACKSQARRVRIAVAGKHLPQHAVGLDEAYPVTLGREPRSPCSFLVIQEPQRAGRRLMVIVVEAHVPHVDLARRQEGTMSEAGLRHGCDPTPAARASAAACKSRAISSARVCGAGEK